MFLLAADAAISFQGQLSPQEQAIWTRMEPAIVTLMQGTKAIGPAALIDKTGLFVAHRKAISAADVTGQMSDGRTISLKVCGQDALSQLVLLQAASWEPTTATPFVAPQEGQGLTTTLIAVLASGPIRAEGVSTSRFGVIKPSRRIFPLSEFRFEAPAEAVGTALVFSERGALLGALNATLGTDPQQQRVVGNSLQAQGVKVLGNDVYGPSSLTVAYTAGSQVMQRVMAGFLSPSHKVEYPNLGAMCLDAPGGGAVVQQIVKDSPAQKAGFRVGDIIIDIGGRMIQNQVEFARVMLDQAIGEKVVIRVRRGPQSLLLEPIIERSDN